MRALITGGAGFIGRHLAVALGADGWAVRTLDLVDGPPASPSVEAMVGSLLDAAAVDRATTGADVVLHLAAKHRFFGVTPEEFERVNVEGTRTVLDAARTHGVRRVVFYSTVAVYGEPGDPTTEETPTRPTTPYGRTKLEAERLVAAWVTEAEDRTALVVRPTVVFGPGNRGNVFRLMRQIGSGLFVPVGEGLNVKSVAYVENLVAATRFLMARARPGIDVYNYADEPHLSFREIATLIHRHLGRSMRSYALPVGPMLAAVAPIEMLARLGGVDLPVRTAILKMNRATHHTSGKLRAAGFRQEVSIDEGLRRMVEWYRSGAARRVTAEGE